jgi:hypothetical protein
MEEVSLRRGLGFLIVAKKAISRYLSDVGGILSYLVVDILKFNFDSVAKPNLRDVKRISEGGNLLLIICL